MPFGSIPDTRTSPSRIAGAIDTIGAQPTEFFPAPVEPGGQGVAAGQRLVPVGAVLGAPGPHPAQVDVVPGDVGQGGEVAAGDDVAEPVAALVVDRHQLAGRARGPGSGPPRGPRRGRGRPGRTPPGSARARAGRGPRPTTAPTRTPTTRGTWSRRGRTRGCTAERRNGVTCTVTGWPGSGTVSRQARSQRGIRGA